jgi:hypothetical protein
MCRRRDAFLALCDGIRARCGVAFVRNDGGRRSRKREGMLYKLGRLLQVAGMIILPVAIAGNLVPDPPLGVRGSLIVSGIGVAVFVVGYLIQQAAKRG